MNPIVILALAIVAAPVVHRLAVCYIPNPRQWPTPEFVEKISGILDKYVAMTGAFANTPPALEFCGDHHEDGEGAFHHCVLPLGHEGDHECDIACGVKWLNLKA